MSDDERRKYLEARKKRNADKRKRETLHEQQSRREKERLVSQRYRLRKRRRQEDANSESDSEEDERRARHNATANEARDRRIAVENLPDSQNRRQRETNQRRTRNSRGVADKAIRSLSDVDEDEVDEQNCGEMSEVCGFCSAKHFKAEKPSDRLFTTCCHKGKVRLPPLRPVPDTYIRDLFTRNNRTSRHFLENIRKYNNAFAMASMGGNVQHYHQDHPASRSKGQRTIEFQLFILHHKNNHDLLNFTFSTLMKHSTTDWTTQSIRDVFVKYFNALVN
jgi:hypothetical protein